jgi:two-component system cell cycle response regulator
LKEFCELIFSAIRLPDILIRYGGEEFVVILPDTSADKAVASAERIRQSVEQCRFLPDLMPARTITVSAGVAQYADGLTPRELIENADNALYEAKWRGRNKVCLYQKKS